MCAKYAIDLIPYDGSEEQKKKLQARRQDLKERLDELQSAINALDQKLSPRI